MPSTSGPSARPTTPLPTVGYVETVKLGLSNPLGSQQYGFSVAISDDGDLVAVRAQKSSATGDDTGGAYVFRTSDDGASWAQVAELVESDAEGALGAGAKVVAIAGDLRPGRKTKHENGLRLPHRRRWRNVVAGCKAYCYYYWDS